LLSEFNENANAYNEDVNVMHAKYPWGSDIGQQAGGAVDDIDMEDMDDIDDKDIKSGTSKQATHKRLLADLRLANHKAKRAEHRAKLAAHRAKIYARKAREAASRVKSQSGGYEDPKAEMEADDAERDAKIKAQIADSLKPISYAETISARSTPIDNEALSIVMDLAINKHPGGWAEAIIKLTNDFSRNEFLIRAIYIRTLKAIYGMKEMEKANYFKSYTLPTVPVMPTVPVRPTAPTPTPTVEQTRQDGLRKLREDRLNKIYGRFTNLLRTPQAQAKIQAIAKDMIDMGDGAIDIICAP
jgi:hypothetical protein